MAVLCLRFSHASLQRLLDEAGGEEDLEKEEAAKASTTGKARVLQDGTYATETAFSSTSTAAARLEAVKTATKPPLRGPLSLFL